MSSYLTLGPNQTGEKYWPPRLASTRISGPLPDPNTTKPYHLDSPNHGLKSEFSTWEEDIQRGIGCWPEILAHDPEALKNFEKENKLPSPHADLMHRRWGFVIIRTDYSEESEGLIAGVMEKIHAWMMADLDAILEPGVVLSAEQRQKMSGSFMNLLLDDKAVYDGLKLEEVYLWFKGFLRTHELDWALVRGLEEPYDESADEWPPQPREHECDWRNEQHSCCNPNCLHPSHLQLSTDVISRDEDDEARKTRKLALYQQSREAREEAYARSSYGKPSYLHPETLEQAKAEKDWNKKYELMKEAEWKLSAQACFVLDLEVMRSITEHDVDPDKYEELIYTEGPFLKISLEEKMYPDGDSPSERLCGKCHIAVNPLAMVYTQMAEESQHEFDIEWGSDYGGGEWNMLLRRDSGWDGPCYPELQSVIEKERADGCPERAAKDGNLELAKSLCAERDARWEELRRKNPFDKAKHKAWEELQRQKPEEIEYQKMLGRGPAQEEVADYEAAWASAYPK